MGLLSREETLDLLSRASRGDRSAREALVEANKGLVLAIASRFRPIAGVDTEDVVQAGFLGLLKAIDAFDPTRGVQFSTYAFPVILGEMRRCLRDAVSVRVSRSVWEARSRVTEARSSLETRLGREPTVVEIAAETGLDPDRVLEAMESGGGVRSIDDSLEIPCSPGCPGAGELVEIIALRNALELLAPRDRMLILLRYLKGYTQGAVAERLGISQAQVSRHEKKALEQLRRLMTA